MRKNFVIVFIITCTFLWLLSSFQSIYFEENPIKFNNSYDFSTGWKIEKDSVKNSRFREIVIERKLPVLDYTNLCLGIDSFSSFNVYIDNKQIYDFKIIKKIKYSKIKIESYQIVKLPKNSSGKNLKIKFSFPQNHIPYTGPNCIFSKINFGPNDYLIFKRYSEKIIYIVLVCILITISILTVLNSILLNKKLSIGNYYRYLSAIVLCIAIWILGESKTLPLLFSSSFSYYIKFIACLLMPIFIYKYIYSEYKIKNKKQIKWLYYFHLIVYLFAIFGQYIGIISFYKFKVLFIIIFLINLQICTYYLKDDFKALDVMPLHY